MYEREAKAKEYHEEDDDIEEAEFIKKYNDCLNVERDGCFAREEWGISFEVSKHAKKITPLIAL